MNAALAVNRKDYFECDHMTEQGTTAIVGFGPEENQDFQCLLCGTMFFGRDPEAEETDRDLAGYPVF